MTGGLLPRFVRATHTLRVLALELVEHFIGEELVGDARDLLGLTPGLGQRRQLALQCAALDVLVGRHLEREPVH